MDHMSDAKKRFLGALIILKNRALKEYSARRICNRVKREMTKDLVQETEDPVEPVADPIGSTKQPMENLEYEERLLQEFLIAARKQVNAAKWGEIKSNLTTAYRILAKHVALGYCSPFANFKKDSLKSLYSVTEALQDEPSQQKREKLLRRHCSQDFRQNCEQELSSESCAYWWVINKQLRQHPVLHNVVTKQNTNALGCVHAQRGKVET